MERVTFLVESSGQLISCMLNPESLVIKRRTGIHQRTIKSVILNEDTAIENGLIYSGGGKTILELDLVFDVSIAGTSIQSNDVRALTKPIWELSENSKQNDEEFRPGLCRFVWGKSWNIPCVISSISERFDVFDSAGVPKRSWLSVRLIRISQKTKTDNKFQEKNDLNLDHMKPTNKLDQGKQRFNEPSDFSFNDVKSGINNYLV